MGTFLRHSVHKNSRYVLHSFTHLSIILSNVMTETNMLNDFVMTAKSDNQAKCVGMDMYVNLRITHNPYSLSSHEARP